MLRIYFLNSDSVTVKFSATLKQGSNNSVTQQVSMCSTRGSIVLVAVFSLEQWMKQASRCSQIRSYHGRLTAAYQVDYWHRSIWMGGF
jgi:hypothetical protein